jgi:large subunit ribosomal protein L21e
MEQYQEGQKVVVDIEPAQSKGMPHRRFQGKVGVVESVRRRSVVLKVMVGNKEKKPIVRLEHIKRLKE